MSRNRHGAVRGVAPSRARESLSGMVREGAGALGTTTPVAVLGITLVALALRLHDVNGLQLFSDSAYSVEVARQSLAQLTASRAYDGHPPLYYYLLFVWLRLAGTTELTSRLPAIFFGVALVPVVYRLGRTLVGTRAGLIAAALVAVSPDLIMHGRLVRMYSLLPLAVAVSWLLFERAMRRGGLAWAPHGLATLLALYSHYYAALGIAGQGIYVLARGRGKTRRDCILSLGLAGLLFLPWLVYAAPSQAPTTAKIIESTPPAAGLVGYLQELWLPFWTGPFVEFAQARVFGAAGAVIVVAAAILAWRTIGRKALGAVELPALMTLTPIVLSLLVFAVLPIAVRVRFLVVVLPFLFLLLAALLSQVRRSLGALLAVAAVLIQVYPLAVSYSTERAIFEPDAVQVRDYLDRYARPGDVVVLQAGWEIGYLEAHPIRVAVAYRDLADVAATGSDSLADAGRVWFGAYNQEPQESATGRSLAARLARVEQVRFGPTRLALYESAPAAPSASPGPVGFSADGRTAGVTLAGWSVSRETVAAGETVAIRLDWAAERKVDRRLVAMVHLLAPNGERVAGQDGAPGGEARPTDTWAAGESFVGRHAFRLPLDLPAGDYDLVAGLYPDGGGSRLAASTGGDTVRIGRLRVSAPSIPPARTFAVTAEQPLTVTGLTADLDRFTVDSQRSVAFRSIGTQLLTERREFYRPGTTGEFEVNWRRSIGDTASAELRAEAPGGFRVSAPAARALAGESGLSLFRLDWPADAPAGDYALSLVVGGASAPAGSVRLVR